MISMKQVSNSKRTDGGVRWVWNIDFIGLSCKWCSVDLLNALKW
jgi:hypothetical protein